MSIQPEGGEDVFTWRTMWSVLVGFLAGGLSTWWGAPAWGAQAFGFLAFVLMRFSE